MTSGYLPEVDTSLDGTSDMQTGNPAIDAATDPTAVGSSPWSMPVASESEFNSAFPQGTTNFSGTNQTGGGREAVIAYAQTMLGTPYQWGGTTPGKGLDCAGFTQAVWKKFGLNLPRISFQQTGVGTRTDIKSLQPGDLVAFGSDAHHVAIYMGNGTIIEAPRTGYNVRIRALGANEGAWGIHLNYGGSTASAASAANAAPTGNRPAAGSYSAQFNAAGRKYGVDPALLSAIAKAESGYNPNARSGAGALGLMQFMPGTAKRFGINPLDATQAIDGGARYIAQLLKMFHGNVSYAIAAYNAGEGAVQKYGGIPPYAETQAYVRRVTGYWRGK